MFLYVALLTVHSNSISDMPITSESDTDISITGIYTFFSIHHLLFKDTYTCYIYSDVEYLELPVKTPSAGPSPSAGTRHYERCRTYNI